jgi:glycogen operon protein
VKRLIRIRKDNPVLRRRKFLQGRRIRGKGVIDIAWLDPSGREMADDAWGSADGHCLGMRLNGDAIAEIDERGERVVGDTLLVLINGGAAAAPFTLPAIAVDERWETLIDTADPHLPPNQLRGSDHYQLQARSVTVLKLAGHNGRLRDGEWGPMGVY